MKRNVLSKLLVFTIAFTYLFSNILTEGVTAAPPLPEEGPAVNFCVAEAPIAGKFPDVSLVFRAYDQNLRPIPNLPEKNIRISESGQTPVPLSEMQTIPLGLGADFYILINKGNRTDQGSVKSVLNALLNYDDPKDQIFIFTDENVTSAKPYYAPGTGVVIDQAVLDFPTARIGSYRVIDNAVDTVLKNINAGLNTCQKPKFLLLILGDEAVTNAEKLAEITISAKSLNTILILIHTPTPNGDKGVGSSYKNAVEANGGYYVNVNNGGLSSFLNVLNSYRQSFYIAYRSAFGTSGTHDLVFQYEGKSIPSLGLNSYQINLLPPQVSLIISTTTITRTAIKNEKEGLIYDKTGDVASVQVTFPDEFNRKIDSIALIINQDGKPELRIPVETSSFNGDSYQVNWSFGDLGDSRSTTLSLKTEVVDELGLTAVSNPDVPIIVMSYIPLDLLAQRYLVYFLSGIVGFLLIIMLIMRRKMSQLMSGVGARVTAVVEGVRKTLIGGGKRGKPLASLKIIDGPPTMIGKELNIFTEVVRLGRDPQRADMTFYGIDVNTSISGLHARIERVNAAWRIVAVSQSGSETFVDDSAIAFNEPYPLESGRTVRLGYDAQQPVVFIFNTVGIAEPAVRKNETEFNDYRKTDVASNTMPAGFLKKTVNKQDDTSQAQGANDDIFNEFRDR